MTAQQLAFADVMAPTEHPDAAGFLAGVWGRTLDLMEVAEEEIEAARQRAGETERGPLWGAYMLLSPPRDLRPYPDALYRAHCREILARVAAGSDTRPATFAQIAAMCERSSQDAPLTEDAGALYWRAFRYCFPEEAARLGYDFRESYPGRIDELESWARKNLRDDERRTG